MSHSSERDIVGALSLGLTRNVPLGPCTLYWFGGHVPLYFVHDAYVSYTWYCLSSPMTSVSAALKRCPPAAIQLMVSNVCVLCLHFSSSTGSTGTASTVGILSVMFDILFV